MAIHLWFSKMENTILVFLKGKCSHGFLPDKPSRRHNGPQNASTVSRWINLFQTLTPHSQPLQTPQNKTQRIMPLVFFVFRENFHAPILARNCTISCNHAFLFFGDFSAFLNLSASRKSDFLFPANIFGGNPARSWPRITPLGHGIAARSTPKQRKTSAFRCVFHTKRANFDGSLLGKRSIHEKMSCIYEKMSCFRDGVCKAMLPYCNNHCKKCYAVNPGMIREE